MKRNKSLFGIAILAIASCGVFCQMTDGGRIGGAISDVGVVPRNQSVYVDIPFAAGEPALVSIAGSGTTNLDLYVYDGDGNSTAGVGFGDRKMATLDVYRAGFFRIEVRNLGPADNAFRLSTN